MSNNQLPESWTATLPDRPTDNAGEYDAYKDVDWRKRADLKWLQRMAEILENWRPPDTSFTMKPYKGREVFVSMLNGKMYEPRTHEPVLDPDGNHLVWTST